MICQVKFCSNLFAKKRVMFIGQRKTKPHKAQEIIWVTLVQGLCLSGQHMILNCFYHLIKYIKKPKELVYDFDRQLPMCIETLVAST